MKPPPSHEEEPDDRVIFGTHLGDLGVIVIAALCTIGLILMLILPSPFAALEKQQAQAEKTAEKAAQQHSAPVPAAAPAANGEVSVGIAAAKKH